MMIDSLFVKNETIENIEKLASMIRKSVHNLELKNYDEI